MPKTKITYSLDHNDVLYIICGYYQRKHGIDVKPDELHVRVSQGYINEGYSSGPDKKSTIDEISFTR